MINIIYSNITSPISIITLDTTLKIVDDDLKCYYESDISDAFYSPKETYDAFIKALDTVYSGTKFPQFKTLALKNFEKSEFAIQARDCD